MTKSEQTILTDVQRRLDVIEDGVKEHEEQLAFLSNQISEVVDDVDYKLRLLDNYMEDEDLS
jgi:hypothetical protein